MVGLAIASSSFVSPRTNLQSLTVSFKLIARHNIRLCFLHCGSPGAACPECCVEELQRIRREALEGNRRRKKKKKQGTKKYAKKFSEDSRLSGVSSQASSDCSQASSEYGGDGSSDSPVRSAFSAFKKKYSEDSRGSTFSQLSSQANSSRSSAPSRRKDDDGRENGNGSERQQRSGDGKVASPADEAAVNAPRQGEEAAPQTRSGFGKLPFSKSLRSRRPQKGEGSGGAQEATSLISRRESAETSTPNSSRSRSLPRFRSVTRSRKSADAQPDSNGSDGDPSGDDAVPRGGSRSRSAPRTKSSNPAQQQRQHEGADGHPGGLEGSECRDEKPRDPPPVSPQPQYRHYGRKPSDGSRGSRASVGSHHQQQRARAQHHPQARDPYRDEAESAENRARSRSLPRLKSTASGMTSDHVSNWQRPGYSAQEHRADVDGAGDFRNVHAGRVPPPRQQQRRSHSASRPPPPSYPGAHGRIGHSDRPVDFAGGGRQANATGRGRSGDPPPVRRAARSVSRSGRPGGDDGGAPGAPHQQQRRADPVVYC